MTDDDAEEGSAGGGDRPRARSSGSGDRDRPRDDVLRGDRDAGRRGRDRDRDDDDFDRPSRTQRDRIDLGGRASGRGRLDDDRRDRSSDRNRDDDRDYDRRRDDDRGDAGPSNRRGGRDRDKNEDRGRDDKDKTSHDTKSDDKQSGDKTAEDKKGGDDKGGDEAQGRRKKRRPTIIAIAVIVVLIGVAIAVWYWIAHRNLVETDDAYTDGNVVAIAPQVSGEVVSLDVNDNQFVHKGDPLVHIDARQYVYAQEQQRGALDANEAQIRNQSLGVEIAKKNFPASLQLAEANLESAKASLLLQKSNYDRQKSLPKQATTQQDVDTATSNFQTAQAQVDQAQARLVQAQPVQQNIGQSEQQVSELQGQAEQAKGRLDQANLNVEWTVVRAPQDGWVTRRNVNKGNYVSSGTQIMSLVTTDVWVTANYKETELDGMRPGQQVRISVDAYPDLDLHGHVDSVQRGSGSRFSAFPAENATGNFIKIVQRVPVKIVIDSGLKQDEPLPLGVSVVPSVMLK